MFEKLDNYIFRRYRGIVYSVAIILILVYEKFDYEIVLSVTKQIFVISIIWILCIFLPRQYFMERITKFNRYLGNKFPFIFKLRIEFINIPYLMKIMISIFFYHFVRFLRKILFVETRNKNLFLFVRLLIYYNILIILIFPFHLVREFYELILDIINSNISILQYLKSRVHYLILSILFMLFFSISRIDLIILVGALDRIIDIYYYGIKSFFELKKGRGNDGDHNCINLAMTYINTSAGYFDIANYLYFLELKRFETILLFKGTNMTGDFEFNFMRYLFSFFRNFGNNKFHNFNKYLDGAYEYYFVDNDGQFLVRLIVKLSGAREVEDYKISIEEYDMKRWVETEFDRKYNSHIFDLMTKFLGNLTKNLNIIDEFFLLYNKYGEFYLHKRVMENNSEIKKFLLKLENLSKSN